jgi:hypothetical protein
MTLRRIQSRKISSTMGLEGHELAIATQPWHLTRECADRNGAASHSHLADEFL